MHLTLSFVAVVTLATAVSARNRTHYGDPNTLFGCVVFTCKAQAPVSRNQQKGFFVEFRALF
jgi:hypothetical protein